MSMSATGRQTEGPALTIRKEVKRDAEERLRQMNITPGSTVMASKKPPANIGQPAKIVTNMYRLDMLQHLRVYRYEVAISGVNQRQRDGQPEETVTVLTERPSSDYLIIERRYFCKAVVSAFLRDNNLTRGIYYDQQRIIYSMSPLNIVAAGQTMDYTLEHIRQGGFGDIGNNFRLYRMDIKPAGDFMLGDYSHVTEDAEAVERIVEQFLDVATAQEIFKDTINYSNYSASEFYLQNPALHGFQQSDCPYFESNYSFLGIGVGKGVRPIQENSGITSGLIVKVKKSPFHVDADELVVTKVLKLIESGNARGVTLASSTEDIQKGVERYVKDIFVETTYREGQIFQVSSLSPNDAQAQLVDIKGSVMTIAEYFATRYDYTLQFPRMPMLMRGKGQRANYYPMELCKVLDYQRVKGQQQTPQQVQEMIKHTAIPPFKLRDENTRLKDSLQLTNSEFMQDAGLRFHNNPVEVDARVLPPPTVEFAQRATERPEQPACGWKGRANYLIPAKCEKWVAVAFYGTARQDIITDREWRQFVENYQQTLRRKGMEYANPLRVEHHPSSTGLLKQLFQQYYEEGVEFMLIAHPDKSDDMHHTMKYWERRTEIVTQGLRIQTVKSVNISGKPLTMGNIINKSNVKIGGLNYAIVPDSTEMRELFGNSTLIIGLCTNHPAGGFSGPGRGGMDQLSLFPTSSVSAENGGNSARGNGNGVRGNGGSGVGGANGLPGNGTRGAGNGITRPGNGAIPGNGRVPGNGTIPGNGMRTAGNGVRIAGNGTASASGSTTQVQHKSNAPSVVGFSSNVGLKHPFEFVGGFIYQPALREEKVRIIEDIIKGCVRDFKSARGSLPRRIVIYRNGCSEGFFQHILKFEVPLMKAALTELGCEAKLTLFVVNKMQPLRLYAAQINARDRAADQNIRPGTVVDTGVVHPKWTEFFLNSHRALQGTASTPRYNVLLDENDLSMGVLQQMTHNLCFGHQIVFSPTALPSPVHIAMEYAKRGRNQYNMWASVGHEQPDTRDIHDHQELTASLGYENTRFLKSLRINA